MTKKHIVEKLTPMVREAFGNAELVVDPTMSAETVDGWTSLAFMRLLSQVAQDFGVKFKIMELIAIRTLGDLVDAIEKKVN